MKSECGSLRHEATLVITNLLTTSDESKFAYFLVTNHPKIIKLLVTNLKMNDVSLIFEILNALEVLIGLDTKIPFEGKATIAYQLEEAGGLDELEVL